eukprot:m.78173 g.78173  ORF g.78173 m.78173 type:complete len:58 (-) comp12523_c1_seq1:101-274(-)
MLSQRGFTHKSYKQERKQDRSVKMQQDTMLPVQCTGVTHIPFNVMHNALQLHHHTTL